MTTSKSNSNHLAGEIVAKPHHSQSRNTLSTARPTLMRRSRPTVRFRASGGAATAPEETCAKHSIDARLYWRMRAAHSHECEDYIILFRRAELSLLLKGLILFLGGNLLNTQRPELGPIKPSIIT